MHLNCGHSIVSNNKGILVIRSECVKKTTKESSLRVTFATPLPCDHSGDKGSLINIESLLRPTYIVACQGVLKRFSCAVM